MNLDSHLKTSNRGRLFFPPDNAPQARVVLQTPLKFTLQPLCNHRLDAFPQVLNGSSGSPSVHKVNASAENYALVLSCLYTHLVSRRRPFRCVPPPAKALHFRSRFSVCSLLSPSESA